MRGQRKNPRKAVQPFENKKRKIDIFKNYEANGVEKIQRKLEIFSTLISKKSISSYDPHEIKFRHILVKTPEEAREIIQSLKVGSDFGSLAKERSLDQSTSQNGGQIPFTNIRNVLVPGLAEAILALQPGELLPVPFKSKLGYHVVLLEEKREVPFPPYEEVKPKLLAELERLQTTEFLNNLQKDAKIILEPPE